MSSTVLFRQIKQFLLDEKQRARRLISSYVCDIIGEQLKERGILPWLDEWELRPGLPWQEVLEQQIEHIKTVAVFVGKDGIGPWQNQELRAFLSEFVQRGCPVIPILLPDIPTNLNCPYSYVQ